MQKMFLILGLFNIIAFTGNEKAFVYTLGNRPITLKTTAYGRSKDIVMIHLHDNEATSEEAARIVLEKTGGMLLSFENNYQRYITFAKGGRSYRFDPNRIFTKSGIKAALKHQNGHSARSAVNAVNGFAHFLLNRIPARTFALIALHNNDDGGLSILSFMKGGDFEKDATAVYKSDGRDPDNFFLTTDQVFFRELRSAGYNVVLQDDKARDDGSLSIYYGRKNKRYINIEAETGNVEEQKAMIETTISIVREEAERHR